MFTYRPSRLIVLFGAVPGLLAVFASFLIPVGTYFIIVGGFSLFMLAMITSQFVFAWHMFKEDEAKRKENMTPCQNCGKPIYKDDTVCPYCHEEVKK